MRRLIKIKEGDIIPEKARFVERVTVDEWDGYSYEYFSKEGLFITTDYRRKLINRVTYFYYEIDE